MGFYVYVLYSRHFNKFYKGQTQDLQNRLKEHNTGEVKSTKPFKPWNIIYFEEFIQREEAVNRERYFKTDAGRRFLKSNIPLIS
jgi:putative endonuclease